MRVAEFLQAQGLADATSTGPATAEDIKTAREAIGEPNTHEEWVEACKNDIKGASDERSSGKVLL